MTIGRDQGWKKDSNSERSFYAGCRKCMPQRRLRQLGRLETRAGKGIPLIRQVRPMFLHCACPRIQGFLQLIFEPAVCGLFFSVVSLRRH